MSTEEFSRSVPEASGSPSYRASMQFACPRCEAEFHCAVGRPAEASPGDVDGTGEGRFALPTGCPECGWDFEGVPSEDAPSTLTVEKPVDSCVVCGGEEFYIQKDFNRALGFWIVLISFTIILLVMLLRGHLAGLYCLFALAVIDYVAYRALRNVTVCYLCHTIYRGFPLHPDHRGFYLGSEEKHKQLRQAWLERVAGRS